MSKPKPYCARTLRHVASRLRAEAKAQTAMSNDQSLPAGKGVFAGAAIACGSIAHDLLNEARAIERKATK